MMQPIDGYAQTSTLKLTIRFKLLEFVRKITKNIVFYIPRNTDVQEILRLLPTSNESTTTAITAESSTVDDERMEIEQNFLNKKLKAITLYFGCFARRTMSHG
jgi:hypothetical protein